MTDQKLSLREACAELARYIGNAERGVSTAVLQTVLDAASSTLPKTRMVERWDVEFAYNTSGDINAPAWSACVWNYKTRADAEKCLATELAHPNPMRALLRVTGPHMQEVPA